MFGFFTNLDCRMIGISKTGLLGMLLFAAKTAHTTFDGTEIEFPLGEERLRVRRDHLRSRLSSWHRQPPPLFRSSLSEAFKIRSSQGAGDGLATGGVSPRGGGFAAGAG